MRCKTKIAFLLFVTLGLAGCGLIGGSRYGRGQIRDDEISLHVINQNYYDARLYAHWPNGRRVSVGSVTGFDEGTFRFRWEYYDVRIEINLLSVGAHYTQWMHVEHGDELELVIDPSLDKRIRRR